MAPATRVNHTVSPRVCGHVPLTTDTRLPSQPAGVPQPVPLHLWREPIMEPIAHKNSIGAVPSRPATPDAHLLLGSLAARGFALIKAGSKAGRSNPALRSS